MIPTKREKRLRRRGRIRVAGFVIAALTALSIFGVITKLELIEKQRVIDAACQQALENTATYLSEIAADLNKGRYIGTNEQLVTIAAKLWKESAAAKVSLMELPAMGVSMDATYKFLSQVGDYAVALSAKALRAETVTEADWNNFKALADYAAKLSTKFNELQSHLASGRLRVENLNNLDRVSFNDGQDILPTFADGFKEAEEGFEGYPMLIYDGPFSDHIMDRAPRMTEYAEAVDRERARNGAAQFLEMSAKDLGDQSDEDSSMPSYRFESGDVSLSVTKQGGYICYMVNSRHIGDSAISPEEAVDIATEFLMARGYEPVINRYHEVQDGICIVNFAATQDDVVLYPDLIKVGVALDDGGVVSFDARGYLVNHYTREFPVDWMTVEEAAESVSQNLTIESSRLAIIPTSGKNEKFVYEFLCHSTDLNANGSPVQDVLVYVNARTGYEEQILLLYYSENGTLTV